MKSSESVVIDGYDLLAESERLSMRSRVLRGRTLNRGTATVTRRPGAHEDYTAVKRAYAASMLPSTLSDASPVIDLTYPASGMFVDSPEGVYLDLYQGVAQKLIDEHHPEFERTIAALREHGLLFRREINTDDYLCLGDRLEGVHTPQELASLVNGLTGEAFPGKGPYRTFFSNSGAEAGEAAIKLAMLHCYRRFLRRHGSDVLARLMEQLGIQRDDYYEAVDGEPVYEDHPFFLVGCDGAFHGRTLGVLNLTRSKRSQHLGYGKLRWVRHIPFNGQVADLRDLLDRRPITEILTAPGGVVRVIDEGRVPVDLAAGMMLEVYQGEGGYRIADKAWLQGLAAACHENGILLGIDEVQSFGRTGHLYAAQHFDVEPDITWMAKAAVLGITVARADLAAECHQGWHSNTFGSGKFFDVNMAYATLTTLTSYRDEVFEGRTYLENSRIKGEYVRMRLGELSVKHEEVFPAFSGLGGMWGLTVRHRDEMIETGWQLGLKLLGCGRAGEEAKLRILLLADVLTREIDEMIEGLDRLFTEIERRHGL